MADTLTIARPYAKALFEHAIATKSLTAWSDILRFLVSLILNKDVHNFICNPATTAEQHVELLLSLVDNSPVEASFVKNLLFTLAENKRLTILPDIFGLYEFMRAEYEKTVEVEVKSFSELSQEQANRLAQTLSKRLQRKVALKVKIDKSLLGGAIINAGDYLVIDGSVRGKLNKLKTGLAA